MRNLLITGFLLALSLTGTSQELKCRVIVNSERVQISDRTVFRDMETAFTEFMNNTKWTGDQFTTQERINCNIILNLDPEQSDPMSGRYGASVQIISSRPVYNTDYETVVFNFGDKDWLFEYVTSQPLQFNENSFLNNITSLLAYYAYIVLGFDYDSFSELGGAPHFQKAWQIVTVAQQSGYPGWEQFNSIRNRYWLAENLMNSQMEPIRKASYEYHMKGLDIFQEKPDEARTNIYNGLKKIQTVNQARPRAILTISFIDTKANELSQIYSDGDLSLRRNVFNLLVNIDPTKRETFQTMVK
ncbi:MAG: DUF4835 family protein [Cyclobacteriaceae bacterium]|nr:DUF4835 family protein [Cyclobacteriaceae bacterium]